jgi:uncharacterized protein (TIGR02453 family)
MSFTGFAPEARGFLHELSEQAQRAWLRERKERFDRLLREPALLLGAALQATLEELSPQFVPVDPRRGPLAPMYRDARFLGDGLPFHESLLLRFPHRLASTRDAPACTLRIHTTGYRLRIGIPRPRATTMALLREHIVKHAQDWKRILKRTAFAKRFVLPEGPKLARAAPGCADLDQALPELRLRALFVDAFGGWEELGHRQLRTRLCRDVKLAESFLSFVCAGLSLPF